MGEYHSECPSCHHEKIEWKFIGNNTYFSQCEKDQMVMLWCSIFNKVCYASFKDQRDNSVEMKIGPLPEELEA